MKAYKSLRELGYEKEYPIKEAILQSIRISARYDYGVDDKYITILSTKEGE